jgi:hypothetical protein
MTNLPPPPPGPGQYGGYQQQGYGYSYGAVPLQAAGFWRFGVVPRSDPRCP